MKKTLLIGLAAVALGSMTACSNILEEEGIVSPSAKTGTLSVGLDADASVNIVTKTTDGYTVPNTLYTLNDFKVTVSNGTSNVEALTGTYSSIKNQKPVVATGTYTLTAMNKEESEVLLFEWDAPFFKGVDTETLTANDDITLTAECTLANSIIDINISSLLVDNDDIEVVSLTAISSDENSFDIYKNNSVVDSKSLGTNMLYAKAEIGAKLKLVVKSKVLDQEKQIITDIKDKEASESTNKAKKKYNVTYSFVEDGQGVVAISVSVNGNVDVVSITEKVDPYANN